MKIPLPAMPRFTARDRWRDDKGTYDRDENSCSGGWAPLYEWDDSDDGGEWKKNSDLSDTFSLRMIDNSGGEIMEYGATVAQCRRIVDDDVCEDECNKGKSSGSDTNCDNICSANVKVPWYCKEHGEPVDSDTHRYKFPVLDRLFGISGWNYDEGNPTPMQTMGVQTNYDQESAKDGTASYSSEESSDNSLNQVSLSSGWSDTIKRQAIFVPYKSNRDSADQDEDDKDDLKINDIDNQKSPDISSFSWETAR